MELLPKTLAGISPELDEAAMEESRGHLDNLLKPRGSFGRLEDLIVKLAGIRGTAGPHNNKKAVIMMCADNGVYEEGFHSYPQEITKIIAELSGKEGIAGGAVFARFAHAEMVTVDVGIKEDVRGAHIVNKKVRYGTGNITKGPAMTREEAVKAVEAGIEAVTELAQKGINLLTVGEAGICNTTTSGAILAVLTGAAPEEVVGRGSGLADDQLKQKYDIVKKALDINRPDKNDPLDVLAKVGGLEIAGMVGCFLAAANESIPVVIDGFISGVAALLAVQLAPASLNYMFPSHLSAEPGARILLEALHLVPYLTLDMRLGEGTGALLAFNIFDCAVKVMEEMGTFADLN
ncbi:MAG: nicotinate-nucleotide--dimethylbenzimidazole phosphoribosyltransferase [Peptococcaceae bacterium]